MVGLGFLSQNNNKSKSHKKEDNNMSIVGLRQGSLPYDTPQVNVIEFAECDVIRTSFENGGEDNKDWWEGD